MIIFDTVNSTAKDYKLVGYKRQIKNVDELYEPILTVWDSGDQRIIDTAVKQCCTRLCACIKS